jgi:hypothetical protein
MNSFKQLPREEQALIDQFIARDERDEVSNAYFMKQVLGAVRLTSSCLTPKLGDRPFCN